MSIREKLERMLLGYTAKEQADIRRRWIEMRVNATLDSIFSALDVDDVEDAADEYVEQAKDRPAE